MNSTSNFSEQLNHLPALFGQHVQISLASLTAGILISLPLAFWAAKKPRARGTVLAVTGIIQTIPSLALLALMVPALVLLTALLDRIIPGNGLSAFGFWPALIALTLYSMLPIVRNTITGINEVDPAMSEAAKGLGMTPLQMLLRVEIPLATPIIVAGIRTATIWVVSMATLSTQVGQPSLGNYIFSGLQTKNWTAVLFGCIGVATLALALDSLLAGIETSVRNRQRLRTVLGVFGLAAISISGFLIPTITATSSEQDAKSGTNIRIGAKTFNEQFILADLMSQLLEKNGLTTTQVESLGSTIIFDALANGDIDAYIEYSGTIWANQMKRNTTESPQSALKTIDTWLNTRYGIQSMGALGFENAYTLAMPAVQAKTMGIKTITDLAKHSRTMNIGSDLEFFSRPEWYDLRDTYHLKFAKKRNFAPTFLYDAVAEGKVDVITAYSSDGRIIEYGLTILGDPEHAIPPYDAVILLGPNIPEKQRVIDALAPMIGNITLKMIQQANLMVDRKDDRKTPVEAALWLQQQIDLRHTHPDQNNPNQRKSPAAP